jgi:hypothetical protein
MKKEVPIRFTLLRKESIFREKMTEIPSSDPQSVDLQE